MVPLYFAYGSNLSSPRLRRRIPEAHALGPARLHGYRLALNKRGHDGSAKANLVTEAGGCVWGVLYRLPEERLAALDRYEGGYRRLEVEVEDAEGVRRTALTYASARLAPDRLPFDWYVAHLVEGAREHGLPATWIAQLEALPCRRGPPEDAASRGDGASGRGRG